jgi:chromosomal replication initiator protein
MPWLVEPPITAIQEAVCTVFRVTAIDLVSDRRDRRVVNARHAAMWLARRASHTLIAIGREFGGRHQTTAANAVRRVDQVMIEDPVLASVMTELAAEVDRMARQGLRTHAA